MPESTGSPPFRLGESRFDQVNNNPVHTNMRPFVFLNLVVCCRLTADGFRDGIFQVNCFRRFAFCRNALQFALLGKTKQWNYSVFFFRPHSDSSSTSVALTLTSVGDITALLNIVA